MPRIEMRDFNGMFYRIDTMSLDQVDAWFHEWLPRLFPASLDAEYGDPLIMQVVSLPDADGKPDWPVSRYSWEPFHISRDPDQSLAALERRRQWIEGHL